MDLLDGTTNVSPLSFIGSSDDEMDPFHGAAFANSGENSFGRPVQRVLPTPRQPQIVRPTVINPLMIPSNTCAFTVAIPTSQRIQEPIAHSFLSANYLAMPLPFYPNSWNNANYNQNEHGNQMFSGQLGFSQSRINNVQPVLQMNPSVMPEVARYCAGCNKPYHQIAVETLTHYLAWSEYPDETIRDRNRRSRAFVHGFGAALICFKNSGLSQAYRFEMSGMQHR